MISIRKMRGPALAVAVAISSCLAFSNTADAGQLKIDRITGTFSGSGGEFRITEFDDALPTPTVDNGTKISSTSFQTFCVEKSEHINPNGSTLYNYSIAGTSTSGTASNLAGALRNGTAYLYENFYNGVLTGYDYTVGSGRAADAGVLQHAVWYFQGQESFSAAGGAGNEFISLAIAALGSSAEAFDTDNLGSVAILNITTTSGGAAQDQLYIDDGGDTVNVVPLPPAVLLGFGLLSGLGLIEARRKRKQAAAL